MILAIAETVIMGLIRVMCAVTLLSFVMQLRSE